MAPEARMIGRFLGAILLAGMAAAAACAQAAAPTVEVLTYHADEERRGNFVEPDLTWRAAQRLRPDGAFRPRVSGHIYAQPLYWRAADGRALLLIATESDTVYALDASSGATVWMRRLGTPVPLNDLPCGDIDPLGITGTPVIDRRRGAAYVAAMVRDARSGKPAQQLFALSLKDGAVLPGWPLDVGAALARSSSDFPPPQQNERGALLILGDELYVPYGGHFGDCGGYHGWVVGVKLDDPPSLQSWHTRARAGGIWAPAGISSDGRALFAATGNTRDTWDWGGGEAVIRLPPALTFTASAADFFAPRDWRQLDEEDGDLGGVAPVLFDIGTSHYALALGKDGNAYLLDRDRPGGFGGSLAQAAVSDSVLRTASAEFPVPGGVRVAFQGRARDCPTGERAGDLTVIGIQPGTPPRITTAWCGAVSGRGAPIVTTTDGIHDPIVWMLGAEGDNRLYGYRGDNGQELFVSAPLPGLRHFQTLIATPGRLYLAADNNVLAFDY
jgi:outer membrane protein assembly factor BamB